MLRSQPERFQFFGRLNPLHDDAINAGQALRNSVLPARATAAGCLITGHEPRAW